MKRKARKQHKPGDLARLIALYRWEWNSLNQYPTPDDESQAKFDVLVKKTYSRITKMLIGVPALCYEDALIAIDLLAWVEQREDNPAHVSVSNAIRDFLARMVKEETMAQNVNVVPIKPHSNARAVVYQTLHSPC